MVEWFYRSHKDEMSIRTDQKVSELLPGNNTNLTLDQRPIPCEVGPSCFDHSYPSSSPSVGSKPHTLFWNLGQLLSCVKIDSYHILRTFTLPDIFNSREELQCLLKNFCLFLHTPANQESSDRQRSFCVVNFL